MSMPGFVFYFRCDACDMSSDEYSIFPFPDIFSSHISLPAWSRIHNCWANLRLALNSDHRARLESDPQQMVDFASSVTTTSLTVCIPRLCYDQSRCAVSITPEPECPYCGKPCEAIFGYPPHEHLITEILPEEFEATPISAIDISVRTRNICSTLGIRTIGQLRNHREHVVGHKQAGDTTVAEVDRWLAIGSQLRQAH